LIGQTVIRLGYNKARQLIRPPRLVALLRPQMRRYYYDPAKYRTYLEQLGITYPTERAADGSRTGGATP